MIINGIDVRLENSREAFSPMQLDLQKEFIEACLKAFDVDIPSFLECPEGTDRKAAILCSALAWIEHRLKNHETTKTNVLYLCGGPADMHRNINEFNTRIRKTYDHEMIVLDSENISAFLQGNYLFDKIKRDDPIESSESKECVKVRPVIFFCTHNLFFETIIRQSIKDSFSLRNTLVIVDNADVVDKTAKKAASAALSNCVVQTLLKDLENVVKDGSKIANFTLNLKIFKKLFTLAPFQDYWISYSHDEIENELKMLCDSALALSDHDLALLKKLTNVDINSVLKFILLIYNFSDDDSKPFKAYATLEYFAGQHIENCKKGSNCKTFHILCLDPSVLIKRFYNFGASLIFTSASIAPISGFKSELKIETSNDFCGKTFIEDFQVYCRIVTCGAGGYHLNSSYSTRHDTDYLTSVGKTLLEFAKLTPYGEGLFVYFVSKDLLELCVSHWQSADSARGVTLWNNICKYKDVIVISREDQLDTDKLDDEKGTCVLLLIRGQIPDQQLPIENRRVIVFVGLPFTFTEDPELKLKKKYIFESRMNGTRKGLLTESGYEEWEAYKIVNKIINRFIESKNHYGAILLCDFRYEIKALLPWLQGKIQRENRFAELIFELKDFFFHVKERLSAAENAVQCTQFEGKVRKWEIQNNQLEYVLMKKKNDRSICCKRYLESVLEERLSKIKLLKQQLQAGKMMGGTPVSPIKENLSRLGIQSPRKRPYPE
ncbi:Regulator of telomere elongation helicase 1-like protein [Frankliniella fusca]|uniref:Regulator of telomere elongation helicase 1-like protein n=1 Tax=Frankliniella fusca TaxID=407009 RepID=A0AAE1L8R8_9NEOP|nr:Regulator of telomere elongation helicase 1-like protein [Frankliniella fusca]